MRLRFTSLIHSKCRQRWAIPPVRLGRSGRNSRKTPETLSERFLEFPSRVWLGSPKPYNSRHLKAPEYFQNSLPPVRLGTLLFSEVVRSGEGLSKLVMEFPAVLGVFLKRAEAKGGRSLFGSLCLVFGHFLVAIFSHFGGFFAYPLLHPSFSA